MIIGLILSLILGLCLLLKGKRHTFAIAFDWRRTWPGITIVHHGGWSCVWIGKENHDAMIEKHYRDNLQVGEKEV